MASRFLRACIWLVFLFHGSGHLGLQHLAAQSIPHQPYSDRANDDCLPCMDTLRVLMVKRIFDVSLLLPEWKPVVDPHFVAELEGYVVRHPQHPNSTHVSPIDYSAYHYTHDFGFDVKPDPNSEWLLARRIYRGGEKDAGEREKKSDKDAAVAEPTADTVLQQTMHVEWESGLGASNKGNPAREANCAGNSAGFFSGGHSRREALWNWPTIGDWVHLEGQWIWDRGHPPARTEIHPIRFSAVRRNLPDRIATERDSVFATRIDLFASGDGGALFNNRSDVPDFVTPVRMSDKDYVVKVRPNLPSPGPGTPLRFSVLRRPGDSHPADLQLETGSDEQGAYLRIAFPWKNLPDTLLLARTVYLWWDVPGGIPADFKVQSWRIDFDRLKFRQRKEFSSRSEFRVFFEAGGQWYFLNEFLDCDDVLHGKRSRTYRKKWEMGQQITLHIPEDRKFRLHVGGWEADGINRSFGHLLNPHAPCTRETKKAMHKHLWAATPLGLHGCLDDAIGEVQLMLGHTDMQTGEFIAPSTGPQEKYDQCPCVRGIQENVFELSYRLRKLD